MRLTQITNILKRISLSATLREFQREFLSTEKLLSLTIEDICRVCPMTNFRGNGGSPELQEDKKVDECRKRYFAALLQSYLGKPGERETDWLDSYLRKCEACYLRVFVGTGATNISVGAGGSAGTGETLSQHSQVNQEVAKDY